MQCNALALPITDSRYRTMIQTIHISLMAIFVFVNSALVVAALVDRMRIRPVRLMWHDRVSWRGYGWSIAWLVLVIATIVYAGIARNPDYIYLGLGYLVGGICWGVAVRLSSATVVTDFALICNSLRAGRVLSWAQVVDYFVREDGDRTQFVFFYLNERGRRARFEVHVPKPYRNVFERLVNRYVEHTKTTLPERAYG